MTATVYSFYSYKGGVGRSMTLANLAALFYRRPLNVIVVDWDLEAPGIERYFADQYETMNDPGVTAAAGLCDMIKSYRDAVSTPPAVDEKPTSPYPDVDRHLVQIDANRGCTLRLLTAGDRSDWAAYADFVQNFDWSDFYDNWAGGGFFDWLRDELRQRADIVLIDTRTGITEMGGVATRQMGDAVIVVFAGNDENMASSARMAEAFASSVEGHRRQDVILVPSRIDDSDSFEYSSFIKRLHKIEQQLARIEPPDGFQTLELLLPYRAALSFREQLIVGDDERQTVLGPLVEGYRRIAATMQRLAPEDSLLRLGASLARGRVYLVEGRHQKGAGELRQLLEAEGYEVVPTASPSGASSSSDSGASELASAGCVVAILDSYTVDSHEVQSVLEYAEQLRKPVIPIVTSAGVRLPLSLANTVPLEWFDDRLGQEDRRRLLRESVRTATSPSSPSGASVAQPSPRAFISYAPSDRAVAEALSDHLRRQGVDSWLDTQDLLPGDNRLEASERALTDSSAIVVLVSPAFSESRWAQRELAYAEVHGTKVLPVMLDKTEVPFSLFHVQHLDATAMPISEVASHVARALDAPM